MDKNERGICRNNTPARRRNASDGNDSGCRALKTRFRQVEFAITETVLYLDAYPECASALDYYHLLLEERNQLLAAINEQCGPMTHNGNVDTDNWLWVKGPWPWKYEAN